MAKFTTRVELLDATYEDYETLHNAMAQHNFTRTITDADSGIEYRFPPAEYNRSGHYSIDQTLESAKSAAATTGKEYRVLVTESNGRKWFNLERV